MLKPKALLIPMLLVVLAACGSSERATPPAPITRDPATPPNVVLVVLDTLRADQVEAVRDGVPVMPHLAELATESLYFTNAISPSSWTKPAMASVMTSLYADVHGVHAGARQDTPGAPTSDVLPATLETMPEYFQEQGYATRGYQTNANLLENLGFAQGFNSGDYIFENGAIAEQVTGYFQSQLDAMPSPFFLYAHYMDPHTQYRVIEGYTERFPPGGELTQTDKAAIANFMPFFWDEVSSANGAERVNKTPRLSEAGKAELRRRYDGECRYLDDQLHEFIETVKARDPMTVFVIIADHGEEFWEHDGMGHGLTLYDDQISVPFIIHGPGIPAERRDVPVSTLGILPTLAGLLGTEPNPDWQGEDVIATAAPGPIFSLTHGSQTSQRFYLESIIADGKKYIEDYGRGFAGLFNVGTPEVAQENQLTEPWMVHPYRLQLSQWRAENRAVRARLVPAPEAVAEVTAASQETLSEEEQEALAALGYLSATDSPADAAPLPNIALIIIDTLRSDRIHGERGGIPIMPDLATFARGAWDFQQAIAQASWTKPSVTSILTGMYTDTHGVNFGVQAELVPGQDRKIQMVPKAVPMMAEYFRDLGYTAIGFQTNQHLQCQYGFGRGFGHDCAAYTNLKWAQGHRVTDAAVAALKETEGPFLLYTHYFDPHGSYEPPAPYDGMFPDFPGFNESDETLRDRSGQSANYYLDHVRHALGVQAERETASFSVDGRESIRYLYDGECRFTDVEVNRLIQYIDAHYDNTIIIITADHGEEFWEHGAIGHAKTVYEEVINVPLIVRLPGERPRVVTTPVETIDILPTLAAALGQQSLGTWQGRDLATVPDAGGEAPVYSLTRGSIPEFGLHLESVRQGNEKLIQNIHHCAVVPPVELYDLAVDPREQKNLAEKHPERVEALMGVLEAHRTAASALTYPPEYDGLDEETVDALEAMGYLDGTASEVPCLSEEGP